MIKRRFDGHVLSRIDGIKNPKLLEAMHTYIRDAIESTDSESEFAQKTHLSRSLLTMPVLGKAAGTAVISSLERRGYDFIAATTPELKGPVGFVAYQQQEGDPFRTTSIFGLRGEAILGKDSGIERFLLDEVMDEAYRTSHTLIHVGGMDRPEIETAVKEWKADNENRFYQISPANLHLKIEPVRAPYGNATVQP